MSELEHALRSALADPPGARPRDTDALYDIELRLTRRRQRRRRTGFGALVVAAVAAIAIPIGVAGPHSSSDTSANSGSKAATDAGGGRGAESAAAVPAAVRKAAISLATAPGSHASGKAEWVRTTVAQWERLNGGTTNGVPRSMPIYVVQVHGHFVCESCSRPSMGAKAPTGTAETVTLAVDAGRSYDSFGVGKGRDLAKLGDVHAFTLR